jgi:hypothetical protein
MRRRVRIVATAAVVLAASAVALGSAGAGRAGAAPSTATWGPDQVLAAPLQEAPAMDCVSTTVCYALGSADAFSPQLPLFLASSDGGADWTSLTMPAPASVDDPGVSCPAPQTCFVAVGTAVLETLDGGQAWVRLGLPAGDTVSFVDCPTVAACYGVGGGQFLASQDGGHTWSALPATAVPTPLELSCGSPTTCVATESEVEGGGVAVGLSATTDGGRSWHSLSLPPAVTGLTGALSCPTAGTCDVAVTTAGGGPAVAVTTDGGAAWTLDGLAVPAPTTLSCTGPTTCLGADNQDIVGTADGRTWTVRAPTGSGPAGLSCATPQHCAALALAPGTAGRGPLVAGVSTDGGTTWADTTLPGGATAPEAAACPTATECLAVTLTLTGESVLRSTDGGRSWSAPLPVLSDPTLQPGATWLQCPTAADCYLATAADGVEASTDGGATWTARPPALAAGTRLVGFACPAPTACDLLGSDGTGYQVAATTDGGAAWQILASVPAPANAAVYAGMACASVAVCVVGGTGIGAGPPSDLVTRDGWSTWASNALAANLSGISCPSPSVCVAQQGTKVATSADGGTTWVPQTGGPAPDGAVTCPSATDCLVPVSGGVAVSGDGGATWATQTLAPGIAGAAALGCVPGTTSCVGVGGWGPKSGQAYPGGTVLFSDNSALVVTTSRLPVATVGSTYSAQLALAGGSGSETWSLAPGSTLPAGLSLGPTGALGGTPTAAGQAVLSFTVADPGGPSATSAPLTLLVGEAPTTVSASASPASVPGGQPVTLSAAVSAAAGDPEGPVDFLVGTTLLCMATVSGGSASCSSTAAPVGTDPVVALYLGADPFAPGVGTTTLTVTPGPLSVATTRLSGAQAELPFQSALEAQGGLAPYTWAVTAGTLPAGLALTPSTGVVSGRPTAAGTAVVSVQVTDGESPPQVATGQVTVTVAPPPPHGYWLVGADGGIFTFGRAAFFGSTGNLRLQRPVVGMAPTTDHQGYWMVATDGGLFAFGDAGYHGSLPALGYHPAGSGLPDSLNAPIVAMVASPDGLGYLLVASDGGVFAFGDAQYHGSCPALGGCSGAVVAVVPTAQEAGYWVVTQTGRVYPFGDATALGQPAGQLDSPVTGAVASADGAGYLIADAAGQVFSYGDARPPGPVPALGPGDRVVGVVADDTGQGYWLVTAAGAVFTDGDAPVDGSMAGRPLNAPMVTAAGF